MDKPIEIKRRAQRFVQSGDLDGALAEYQKLAKAEPNEPYHVVVIADLQFRKGDQVQAAKLYLEAVDGYQQSTLYKNAIAVCKKMVRLGLAPSSVFRRLGELHVHDGLRTEAGLYFMQHGEMSARRDDFEEAEKAYRSAFDSSPENVVALERLADLLLTRDATERWRETLEEAAAAYEKLGQINEATRCRNRISGGAEAPTSRNGARAGATDAPPSPGPSAETPVATPVAMAPPVVPPTPPAAATAPPAPPAPPATPPTRPPVLPVSIESKPVGDPAMVPSDDDLALDEPTSDEAVEVEPELVPEEAPADEETESASGEMSIDTITDPLPALREAESAARPEGFEQNSRSQRPPVKAQAAPEQPGLHSTPEAEQQAEFVIEHDETEPEPAAEHRVEGLPLGEERMAAPSAPEPAFVAPQAQAGPSPTAEAPALFPQGPQAPVPISESTRTRDALIRLLENCRERSDNAGAAATACELGDLALMEGDRLGAIEWFERALEFDPGCQQAKDLIHRLVASKSADTSEVPMFDLPVLDDEAGEAVEGIQTISSMQDEGRVDVVLRGERFDLGSLVSSFQEQLNDQLQSDHRSHFDLGMTYREMGMYDQAMESFRLAGESPEYVEAALEMMGRCLMDQGRFDDAAETLQHGVAMAERAGNPGVSLRYNLGLAYEAGSRFQEALAAFETVYKKDPGHVEVSDKIRNLLKVLGNG